MNMISDVIPATPHCARPKGVPLAKRQQERSEVEEKFRNVLHQWGFPHAWNWTLAYQAYDAFMAHWGYPPPNKNYLESAMATEAGQEWLAKAAEPVKAEWEAMQANRAADAARKAAEAPKPAVASAPVVEASTTFVERDIPGRLAGKLKAQIRDARREHLRSGVGPKGRNDSILDEAIIGIAEACAAEQVFFFTMPYRNWTPVSGVLIGRLMELQRQERIGKFFFRWLTLEQGGLTDEEVEMPKAEPKRRASGPTFTLKPKAKGAEKPAETPAQRKLRIAAESRKLRNAMKGTNGGGDGGKGQKKQGKGKK